MDRKLWESLEKVLDGALDLPREQRAEYLDRACDPALRAEVDALLADEVSMGSFLERPAAQLLDEGLSHPVEGGSYGPYQLVREVGRGGMGVVFEALDTRLGRRVAIKFLPPGWGEGEHARERFLREARSASALDHPNLGTVFDIGESDDGRLYIVMAFYEGETLRARLERGPLSVDESVNLAVQLARGLERAHEASIVHRDIKPANILMTTRGELKILDFGIAKIADEEGLTLTGGSLGTPAYMSPEQARGAPTDERTDLWSVGVVLFEMLVGERPFGGSPAVEAIDSKQAMTRLVAGEASPPQWLARVVERLLAKEPAARYSTASALLADLEGRVASPRRRRWRRALVPILAGVTALAIAIGLWLRGHPPRSPRYVAAAEVEVESPAGAEAEIVARAVHAGLVQGLVGLRGLATLTGDGIGLASSSPLDLARALAADEVITSRVSCLAASCQVELRRLLGEDGRVLWLESFAVPVDDLSLVVSAVAARTRQGFSSHRSRKGTSSNDFAAEEWREFLELRRAFETKESLSDEVLVDRLEALRLAAPSFLEVYLLEAEVLRQRFHFSRDEQALERGFDLLRRAQDIAPGDSRALFLTFDLGNLGGRWDLSERALESLERSDAGSSAVIKRRAQLLSHQGDSRAALELLRKASRLHPSSEILTSLAFSEYRTGEVEAAMATLTSVLEQAPNNFRVLSFLAQLELAAGNIERSVELFERLVARSRGVTELSNLGLAHTLLGEAHEATAKLTSWSPPIQWRLSISPMGHRGIGRELDLNGDSRGTWEFAAGYRGARVSLGRQAAEL